jgi:transcriptional antiterminator NusG
MALRWYVVQAYSGYEKTVKLSLEDRIARSRSELKKCFGQHQQLTEDGETEYLGPVLVPTEEVVEMRAGQKRRSERRLFPGYVLIQMDLDSVDSQLNDSNGNPLPLRDEIWHLVKDVPKVMGFIGGTLERPAPISDTEANAILQRIAEGASKPRPKVLFEVGEVVRVTEGPFADFNGVVEEVNYEKNRLRVAVLIFGRSTPIELEFGHVEKD